MKTPSKYYIEVTSATYTGDDLADYLENGPLYRDDEGTASDVTCEVAALRAENERLRDLHWREAESLRERLDQFEAYAMPNVATALDRIAAAEARAAEAERRVAELEARGHDGQPCTTERPCCVCEGRIAAEARAERLAGAAEEVVLGEWWGHYCPCCHATAGHGPGCLIGKLAAALAEEPK